MDEAEFNPKDLQKRIDELDKLKTDGVDLEETDPLAKHDLAEPQRGEEVVGELTHEEASIYAQCIDITNRMNYLTRQVNADSLSGVAEKLRGGEELIELSASSLNVNVENLKELLRCNRQYDYYYNMFWWRVGERLNKHEYSLGVRSKGRVISKGLKYEIRD